MKVTVTNGEVVVKEFDIPLEKITRFATKASILGVLIREINRVRPAKRNIGVIINALAATAMANAIMNIAFPEKEKNKEPEVVADANAEEVKVDTDLDGDSE